MSTDLGGPAAIALEYLVEWAGLRARIQRETRVVNLDLAFGVRPPADAETVDLLRVAAIDGCSMLTVTDSTRRPTEQEKPINLTAEFLIGDDIDGALRRATSYAAAMCEFVAAHRAEIDTTNVEYPTVIAMLKRNTGAMK